MSVLFRRFVKTAILSRFLKVAMATSNFMNEIYNGGFASKLSVSMLKQSISLVWDYVYETRKQKAKLAEKYICKQNMKSFSAEALNFSFRKFLAYMYTYERETSLSMCCATTIKQKTQSLLDEFSYSSNT